MADVEPNPTRPAPSIGDHVRPLTIGDILDVALRLYRAHFRPLFLTMLVIEVPIYLLQKIYETLLKGALPAEAATGQIPPEAVGRLLATLGLLVPLTFLGMMVLLALARGALIAGGSSAWLGGEVDFGRNYAALRERLWPLLGTYVLLQILIALAMLLGAVPGAVVTVWGVMNASLTASFVGLGITFLGSLIAALILYLRWYLVIPVLMLEGLSGLAAFGRSARMMAGGVTPGLFGLVKMRASILLLVLFFLLLVPGLLIGIPQYLIASLYTAPGMPPDLLATPFLVRLPLELIQMLLATLLTPYSILAMLVFYYDLRIRREGFDLELRAAALGGGG